MRLLVHGASLARRPRMALAALGLALRGHDVRWLGGALPPGGGDAVVRVASAIAAGPVDIVIGGAESLARVAWDGWMAGAHGAVVDADAGGAFGFGARVVWGMIDGIRFEPPGSALPDDLPEGSAEEERHEAWDAMPETASPDPAHPDVERLERACERLAAWRRTRGGRAAVFLDRDGTLVVEREYLSDPDDVELLPGVPGALRSLHAAGYALIVISNQSGVGRGLFGVERVHAAMARVRRLLRREGVELDAVYFCPHRPEDACACRKPAPELLLRAARNQWLSLRDSAMVGDKALDVETGHRAGARGVLVRTGYGRAEEAALAAAGIAADAVVEDLAGAAPWLIERAPDGAIAAQGREARSST